MESLAPLVTALSNLLWPMVVLRLVFVLRKEFLALLKDARRDVVGAAVALNWQAFVLSMPPLSTVGENPGDR